MEYLQNRAEWGEEGCSSHPFQEENHVVCLLLLAFEPPAGSIPGRPISGNSNVQTSIYLDVFFLSCFRHLIAHIMYNILRVEIWQLSFFRF